ncbi:MAG: FG-GAP-like repeat-containing protein [Gemmataceae bacterium]|nr:FG-GAP-like repeat-containing protein [Gemmataceae bacterium]
MSSGAQSSGRSSFLLVFLVLLLLGGGAAWWFLRPKEPDMTAVLNANLRGIGHLEQFAYHKAAAEFENVVRLAPSWIPGRINLGIALLNWGGKEKDTRVSALDRAVSLFQGVLKEEPDNPHAHYCLGIIQAYKGQMGEAQAHFEKVTQLDPDDAHAWLRLGLTQDHLTDKRRQSLTQALEKDPYLTGALWALSVEMAAVDRKQQDKLLAEFKNLNANEWATVSKDAYSVMGKYSEAIGMAQKKNGKQPPPPALPKFEDAGVTFQLPEGCRFAKEEEQDKLIRAVRARFGVALAVLDFDGSVLDSDRDIKLDLYCPCAVFEKGVVRDALFRNEGNGKWKDVSHEVGLGNHASLGVTVADYDNDGFADIVLTGISGVTLLHNEPEGKERRFVNVTPKTPLAELKTVCLGVAVLDLDQDGDLDLVVAQFAHSPAEGLDTLDGKEPTLTNGLAVFLNAGEAIPGPVEKANPLSTKFLRADPSLEKQMHAGGPLVNFGVCDVDRDRDVDLICLPFGKPACVALNDRLLRFHAKDFPKDAEFKGPAGTATRHGCVILDTRNLETSDLFLIGEAMSSRLWLNGQNNVKSFPERLKHSDFPPPGLIQGHAVDIDLDGWTDVVGHAGTPILFLNHGGELKSTALASLTRNPILGMAVADVDNDFLPDLILFTNAGLVIHRNLGNGNQCLKLQVIGRREAKEKLRVNSDAIGTKLRLHAMELTTGCEIGTFSAGLGQSRQPLLFGLGKHALADVLRIRWPDGTWQAELSLPAKQLARFLQINRMPDSCPVLFSWDGEKFVFICDFLGGGAIGEALPDRTYRQPRPEESLFIDGTQLQPKDGKFVLKLAEPMDEVAYVDRLQLTAIDHPQELRVFPEERFAAVAPSQDLLALGAEIHPVSAKDQRGIDVASVLRNVDRRFVDGFLRRSWLGYAEEHFVELDFADQLTRFGPKDRLFLCLQGWTDYPYPEAMWAATQAGVPLIAPVLERQTADGNWETIVPEVGFPAGRPRMMLVEITGKVNGPACKLRLRTNMQVFWDQLFVAPVAESLAFAKVSNPGVHKSSQVHAVTLPVLDAHLTPGGIMQEYSPDGKQPTLYNYHKHDAAPVSRLKGNLTRFGDVAELLHQRDERFVVFGPSDDLTVTFDAKLPPLPSGWTRSYVLQTAGYCKTISPWTVTSETVEPLPFQGMSQFPYPATERYPRTPLHQEYLRKYQTRQVGR